MAGCCWSVGLLLTLGICGALVNALDYTIPQSSTQNINECPSVSSVLQSVGFTPSCVSASLSLCSTFNEGNVLTNSLQAMHDGMTEVKEAMKELNTWRSRPRHCKDLLSSGDSGQGIRQIYPYPQRPYDTANVICEQTVDGGGWTVFQHRTSSVTPRQDFYRTWVEYQLGFGKLDEEFWLGLDLLHILTSGSLQELRVDLMDYDGGHRFAKYGVFYVGPESDKFRLKIGRYSGDAGDSFSYHGGRRFSTHDVDEDIHATYNCAERYRGAWWYGACHNVNINGYQYEGAYESDGDGIVWQGWRGDKYSLMNTTLMIRPAF